MKNWIDKALEPFAPGRVAQRLAARQMIYAYEAAAPSRLHKAKGEAKSADMAVQLAGRSLREQARYLDENHDLVTGILDRLEERVVGADGIGIEPIPLDRSGNRLNELAAQIKTWWAEWSLHPETTGELTRPQMERLVCRSWLRDGEVLAQELRGRIPSYQYLTATPYALELLEADYLPLDADDPKRGIFAGIERNEWRRVRAYHIYKSHPGDMRGWLLNTKRVEAERMIHLAHRKRLQQSRGITILHSVITRLADLKDYEESERVAARIAAAMTMYIKKGDPATFTDPTQAGNNSSNSNLPPGSRQIPIAPGMTFDGLLPGEDVGMIESNRPNALVEGFRGAMIKAVAAGTRGGASTWSRDYDGTYSAQRQELVEAQLGYELLQDEFIAGWCRRVYRSALSMAVLNGDIALPPDLDERTLYNAFYLGPVMPWINPQHEARAWEELVAAGFADEAEVARARGRNPQELKKSREAEIKENREKGLVFSSDPYHDHYGSKENGSPNAPPQGAARRANREPVIGTES
ncbi:MAG: putative portal protein [Prokaryotic dsDNA virus sp.]|jgi:lambda family phage portal protein|nr:MAG: putative portal protein [Prokaryotic dsDNA virus sp.]QDP48105.1 MAG: putative portal protein [Prokaryotic dsDNA virus sp.]QDP53286.1 MAG: putative portal protein [Prokaryotic dsDNA virus sp.]HAO01716.1 phage portal protein [Halomonas sp.]|tara:strand:- start:2254 stop:3825 length:1572 start_codon:yes stop_codon:yes gene_type:complete